jgi:uncharacterized protein YjiS (DUF1127 family)
MIRAQALPAIGSKSKNFAIPTQTVVGTSLSVWLGFINNLSAIARQMEARAQLRQLTLRQLDDIGLTVAERDALAGLPRR